MGRILANKQKGNHFRVPAPPSLPASPSFPKKINFVGGGLGAGFALGLAILYLLMAMDKTVHTERDVEVCLKLPALASIPLLEVSAAGNGRAAFPKQSRVARNWRR